MIGVLGAGAFGTALATALAAGGRTVVLWGRDTARVTAPAGVTVTGDLSRALSDTACLIAVPMQGLRGFLDSHGARLDGRPLVACCKGIDLETLEGPSALIRGACPNSPALVLSGPSFAADIVAGLPTALTLAGPDETAAALQKVLSTETLRLYRTEDIRGVEIGGALKNVIAIAAGIAMGAGLGESARAALLTRGYAEMVRIALRLGGQAETLAGLSGLGDLVLTATSGKSRNYAHGVALGSGNAPARATVEGIATAQAADALARRIGVDAPVTAMVAAILRGEVSVADARERLLSRPLKAE